MDQLHEFDVRDSFDAMDEDKLGKISVSTFYTMYLGMGYPKATLEDLCIQVTSIQGDTSFVTLDTALAILSKLPRNREDELAKAFSLVDKDGKGFVSAQDIQLLAEQGGRNLTMEQAETIAVHSATEGKIFISDFRSLFSPQHPQTPNF